MDEGCLYTSSMLRATSWVLYLPNIFDAFTYEKRGKNESTEYCSPLHNLVFVEESKRVSLRSRAITKSALTKSICS